MPWRRRTPLQYSCLGNLMDRGAWRATVHRVSRVRHDLVTKTTKTLFYRLQRSENYSLSIHSVPGTLQVQWVLVLTSACPLRVFILVTESLPRI